MENMVNDDNQIFQNIHIEILVEEPTMEQFLNVILPKILPEGYQLNNNLFIRPHQGKSDLQQSLRTKMKAYKNWHKPIRLIIIQDQDSNDCKQLKNNLISIVRQADPKIPVLVRIACRELENWYLGDLLAVENAYPKSKAGQLQSKSKYREPDRLEGASEMKLICQDFSKSYAAREISKYMSLDDNRSASFKHLITGIKRFLTLSDFSNSA